MNNPTPNDLSTPEQDLLTLKVLVLSSNPLVRIGLAALLNNFSSCDVISDMPHDDLLSEQLRDTKPDLLLWDFGWDTQSTIQTVEQLAEENELPPILALIGDDGDVSDVQTAPIAGILSADSNAEQLYSALIAIKQGLFVLDTAYATSAAPVSTSQDENAPIIPLTPREQEVLALLAEGLSNKQIAHQLAVSQHTVKFHINAIFQKMNVQSRTEAVVQGMKAGLLNL